MYSTYMYVYLTSNFNIHNFEHLGLKMCKCTYYMTIVRT